MTTARPVPLDVRHPAPGIARFTVPLAFPSPDHLHVHVLDTPEGPVVVDTGCVGSEEALDAGLAALGVESPRVLVTHAHIDHWGLATRISDTILAHDGIEDSLALASGTRPPRLRYPGLPDPDAMNEAFRVYSRLFEGVPRVSTVRDGDRIGDWRILHTPGHDSVHISLLRERDGLLLCGDLLLPGFTPNIQPHWDEDTDSLDDFLRSLDRIAGLPVSLVLPAHGEPYADAAGRARELREHHARRLERLLAALGDGPQDTSALRDAAFGDHHSSAADRLLAALETHAHLDHLRRRSAVSLTSDERWTLAA